MIGLLRQEALRPNSPSYYNEAKRIIGEYVDYYNNKRLHAGIKFLKPIDVFIGNDKLVIEERQRKLKEAKEKRIAYNLRLNKKLMEAVPA